jgi:hypothetical protein
VQTNQIEVWILFHATKDILMLFSKLARKLLEAGANPSARDHMERTSLHYAVIASSGNSFEMEDMLLSKGADVNAKDKRQRTPMHYAFVKIGGRFATDKIDPIETISSLCAVKGVLCLSIINRSQIMIYL